ncbi:winged helix-turn-helix domain-containing protein [Pararhizobium capsulatum]|nr:winged helix-turn-helix domain-containing protein [Pararhizobium capsulatum]
MMQSRQTFGSFVLDSASGVLRRNGKPVALGGRSLALLKALLDAGGGIVSKLDLMERGWPGLVVEEGNLTVQIAALRKALGPAPEGQEWIATVPRMGYRLIRASSASNESDSQFPVLAVLPFANLSGDVDQDYFADGIVDDIITALSRFKDFSVIARNSAFVYREQNRDVRQVAKELGVRYVLEGSVRRSGNQLRIAAQLIDGGSGAHLWAKKFDGTLDDVFNFQDRITEKVATVVEPHIRMAEIERSRRERPGSMAAYDAYLRALSKILAETVSENALAYAMLTEALALEPDNAHLLAHAAWALEHRVTMGWPAIGANDREKCFELARRGLEKAAGDPTVMAHCAMALVQVAREYDWGMAVLSAALDSNPNNMLVVTSAGVATLHCGEVASALALFQRASRLSPRDLLAHISQCGMAHAQIILGNYEEALTCATRALAINPNFDPIYWMLTAANAHLGRMAEAHHYLGELVRIAPDVTIASIKSGQPAKDPSRLAAIVEGLQLAGLPED